VRSRAQELAAEALATGDATGWFDQLYREAESGGWKVSWADLAPNPNLLEFWEGRPQETAGKTALCIGCGLGDDAEQFASWGFATTAFDISETAIETCRRRFPQSPTVYAAADLLRPPPEWTAQFDFVFEAYTLQVLPPDLRAMALRNAAAMLNPGGKMLLIARGREEHDPAGSMPWPLTRREVESVPSLTTLSFEDYMDRESPPVRRFRILYDKP
jgi:2-polyprenyl-3-methyl-5-hydroxy-6-metoxy-1,4-benzoquinol methylase